MKIVKKEKPEKLAKNYGLSSSDRRCICTSLMISCRSSCVFRGQCDGGDGMNGGILDDTCLQGRQGLSVVGG